MGQKRPAFAPVLSEAGLAPFRLGYEAVTLSPWLEYTNKIWFLIKALNQDVTDGALVPP